MVRSAKAAQFLGINMTWAHPNHQRQQIPTEDSFEAGRVGDFLGPESQDRSFRLRASRRDMRRKMRNLLDGRRTSIREVVQSSASL
jgi:hypothetical protein